MNHAASFLDFGNDMLRLRIIIFAPDLRIRRDRVRNAVHIIHGGSQFGFRYSEFRSEGADDGRTHEFKRIIHAFFLFQHRFNVLHFVFKPVAVDMEYAVPS